MAGGYSSLPLEFIRYFDEFIYFFDKLLTNLEVSRFFTGPEGKLNLSPWILCDLERTLGEIDRIKTKLYDRRKILFNLSRENCPSIPKPQC